jgi:hypothetical protein
MRTKVFIAITVIVVFFSAPVLSQDPESDSELSQNGLDQVRLFQSYFFDSPITPVTYGEGSISLENYEFSNVLGINVSGGYPINDRIEIQVDWGFSNISPEIGDSESGIRDIEVYGRYSIMKEERRSVSAGGYISLPIGSEDIGEGKFNIGGFAAGRYYLENGMAITANFGLISIEVTEYTGGTYDTSTGRVTPLEEETSHEISVRLGGGCIYPVDQAISAIGEIAIQSKYDYMMLSGGIDYQLGSGNLRAMLGLGMDDGAPDFMIKGGYEISLGEI